MFKRVGIGIAGLVAIAAIFLLFSWWYTVDQGDRAVILRNGAFHAVSDPGWHLKLPFLDSVNKITVRTQVRSYDKVATYSRDQQPAEIRVSINFHIPADQVGDLYSRYGSVDALETRLLDPKIYEYLKNVFGQYNAVTAIQERAKLNLDIENALRGALAGQPVFLDSFQVENIDFSDAYEHSVEDRMLAEVEVAKLRQNAEREQVQAQIVVIQAQAKADAITANAKAEAGRITLIGDAQADVIKKRGDALRQNPLVVDLTAMEKWNGSLPTTMVPGSTLPFLNIGNLAKVQVPVQEQVPEKQ